VLTELGSANSNNSWAILNDDISPLFGLAVKVFEEAY
jgi:hypothetical protein